jgi:hypothetical protein
VSPALWTSWMKLEGDLQYERSGGLELVEGLLVRQGRGAHRLEAVPQSATHARVYRVRRLGIGHRKAAARKGLGKGLPHLVWHIPIL